MLFSTHYDADCINNGFLYVRATNTTARWLFKFFSWYYKHTYENIQRGMNVFLNHSDGIRRKGVSNVPADIPKVRYGILDAANRFPGYCGKGWKGRFMDMVLFHWCAASFEEKWQDLNELYRAAASDDFVGTAEQIMEKHRLDEEPVKRQCW